MRERRTSNPILIYVAGLLALWAGTITVLGFVLRANRRDHEEKPSREAYYKLIKHLNERFVDPVEAVNKATDVLVKYYNIEE